MKNTIFFDTFFDVKESMAYRICNYDHHHNRGGGWARGFSPEEFGRGSLRDAAFADGRPTGRPRQLERAL